MIISAFLSALNTGFVIFFLAKKQPVLAAINGFAAAFGILMELLK